MSDNYVVPEFGKDAFDCPYCNAYAKQEWLSFVRREAWSKLFEEGKQVAAILADQDIWGKRILSEYINIDKAQRMTSTIASISAMVLAGHNMSDLMGACCSRCGKYSYWHDGKLIYLPICTAPMPNEDMPEDCKKLYNEAREIADKSPRGAAALLRLCVQMLMPELGEKGKNINDDIASLVKQHKIPQEIQQALDVCRVVGNNAVHPGEIDIDDNPQIVSSLFKLLNIIVEKTITAHKEINSLYAGLPQAAQQAIAKRDET